MSSVEQLSPRLHHIGYVVPNMERAIGRFQKEGAIVLVGPTKDPIQRVECCLLEVVGGAHVELVAPLDAADSPVASRLRRGGGFDHLCFAVDDVEHAVSAELENGSTVVCDPVYAVTFDTTIAFVLRRSGMLVEYLEEVS